MLIVVVIRTKMNNNLKRKRIDSDDDDEKIYIKNPALYNDIINNVDPTANEIVEIQDENTKHKIIYLNQNGERRLLYVNHNNLLIETPHIVPKKNYLVNEIAIKSNLTFIHEGLFGESILTMDKIDEIQVVNGHHKIFIYYPWKSAISRGILTQPNERKKNISSKHFNEMMKIIEKNISNTLLDKYNITINQNVNNYIYNINQNEKMCCRELLKKIVSNNTTLKDRYRFANGHSYNKGYYVCMDNGIWKPTTAVTIDSVMAQEIDNCSNFDSTEKKFLHMNSRMLREKFALEILDENFQSKLDSNLDLFVMNNCCFDIKTNEIRKTMPQDYVQRHASWDYSQEMSEKYMPQVLDFFEKIFPIPQEKNLFLRFASTALHGHRTEKTFVILMDKRQGDNGKSTLMTLLQTFFGKDYSINAPNFLYKSHFEKDRNSHDAGLAHMAGKRLLVMDELKKYRQFDDGFIKTLAGGEYECVGRRLGKEENFSFLWQAIIITCCNEGDLPKFDSSDSGFIKRMLIVPMRSKFLRNPTSENEMYTFLSDPELNQRNTMLNWCSSILDLFRQYCGNQSHQSMDIPDTMLEWKDEEIEKQNDVGVWIMDNIVETDVNNNFCNFKDLYSIYKNTNTKKITYNAFILNAKAYLAYKNIVVKDKYVYRDNNKYVVKRHCIVNYKIKKNI